MFSFELTGPDGTVIETVTNAADGSIEFSKIAYTLADAGQTYTYTVKETSTDGNGITVDTTTYTVTVEVTDNGDGTLTVTAPDNATALDFVNTYAAEGESTFAGTKTIEGRKLTDADVFTFEIKEGETVIATVNNDATGKIAYPTIKYTLADVGTHTYTITEVRTDNGYTLLKEDIEVVISQVESTVLCDIYESDIVGLIQNDPRYAEIIKDSRSLIQEYSAYSQERKSIINNARIEILMIVGCCGLVFWMVDDFSTTGIMRVLLGTTAGNVLLLYCVAMLLAALWMVIAVDKH